MYRKFLIKVSLSGNMFSRSNMDYCLVDVTSEGVMNMYITFRVRPLFPEICSFGQYWRTVGRCKGVNE